MRKHFSLGIVLTAVVFIAFLAACGGGGGGTTLKNHYDGPAGAAAIGNIVDAEEIVIAAYESREMLSAAELAYPMMGPGAMALSLTAETLQAAAAPTGTMEYIVNSSGCTDNSGTNVITVTIDAPGSYSINYNFNNYCEPYGTGEEYMDGSVSVSGSYDLTADELTSATVTITSMTIQEYDSTQTLTDDMTLSGKLTLSASGDTMTMNMTAKDNISGESIKAENYKVSVTDTGTAEEITVTSGKFYHSEYGSVSISTKDGMPLVLGYSDDHPSTGVLVFTGDGWNAELDFGGAGGPNKANLSLDSDNDGTFDEDKPVDL